MTIARHTPAPTLPLAVGITGGIGSGKTTVCAIFSQLGIPVYYSDDRTKALMTEDALLVQGIRKLLGPAAYHPGGGLNRAYIAGIVFQDKSILTQLNSLVHPVVQEDAGNWRRLQSGAPYTVQEAALLFESGSYLLLDRMIVISAPDEVKIQRVMRRDALSREAVQARINSQWPDEKKAALADFIICNDGEKLLLPQVLDVHRALSATPRH